MRDWLNNKLDLNPVLEAVLVLAIYLIEKKLGFDLNGDGYIGNPKEGNKKK